METVPCAISELFRVQQWTKPVMIEAMCWAGDLESHDFLCKSSIAFYSEGVFHVNCVAHSLAIVENWGRGAWRAGRARRSPQNEFCFACYLDDGVCVEGC